MADEDRPGPGSTETVVDSHVDARSTSLIVIAVAAAIFLLGYAWQILLPAVLALLISYALDPIVIWLTRRKVPRMLGAALVLAVVVGSTGYGIYSLRDDALAVIEDLPPAAKKLRQSLRQLRGDKKGAIATVTQAATEIEKTAAEGAVADPVLPGVTRVQIEEKPLDLTGYLWSGSMGLLGFVGNAVLVIFLVFFFLSSGDLYRRKLVKLAGPTLSRQRVTVQILDEITAHIERFLFVQMFTSLLVALASTLTFYAVGLEKPVFWGIAAGLLNSVPYFGPVIVMTGVAVIAFLQFGTLDKSIQVSAASLVITSLEGFLLTPYLLGKSFRMNAAAIIVGLMFWGWLWGAWGLLLAAPLMVVLKSVCDRVENLRGVGELLGD